MLRRFIKTGTAVALHWAGADKLVGALTGLKRLPLVIGYHRVVEDTRRSSANSIPAMLISRRMLEQHLDWIGRRFRFLSLDELGSRLGSGEGLGEQVAAVTFDDGYRDAYEHAFQILKRKGIPGAFFLVTDLIGTSRAQIHDELYLALRQAYSRWGCPPRDLTRLLATLGLRLREVEAMRNRLDASTATGVLLRALAQGEIHRCIEAIGNTLGTDEGSREGLLPLTWEMVAQMHREGMVIGSHTRSHAWLTNETLAKLQDEIAGSRQALQQRLGIDVRHFAYPDGRFTADTVTSVAASGYRFAYTTCRHRDPNHPLLTIPRRLLWENSSLNGFGRFSSTMMSCQVNRVFEFVNCSLQNHRA